MTLVAPQVVPSVPGGFGIPRPATFHFKMQNSSESVLFPKGVPLARGNPWISIVSLWLALVLVCRLGALARGAHLGTHTQGRAAVGDQDVFLADSARARIGAPGEHSARAANDPRAYWSLLLLQ